MQCGPSSFSYIEEMSTLLLLVATYDMIYYDVGYNANIIITVSYNQLPLDEYFKNVAKTIAIINRQ